MLTVESADSAAVIDWYGTVRALLGVASGPVRFYGTGGFAYGNVAFHSNFNTYGVLLSSQGSSVQTGWTGGAGFDYLLRPDLMLRFGYLHIDLGTPNLTDQKTTAHDTINQNVAAHAQFDVFTLGLSWMFSAADSPQTPWRGFYLGGQAGGASGNYTDARYTPSDARLKRDIMLVGRRPDGLGIYSYRYLWSDVVYVGVMGQEVALIHPEAVVRDNLSGYLSVDYGRLGMRLMRLSQPAAGGPERAVAALNPQ